jgi:hypothetical protein
MTWTETVPRPGRRPYRARKRPYAELIGGDWDDAAIVVWRTHDVDAAVALAHRVCAREGLDVVRVAEVGWYRTVPWDTSGGHYDYTVEAVLAIDRGAVPGVWFRC